MKNYTQTKRAVTTSDVIKTLRKQGKEVTEKQAEEILDFLYFLAELIVKQNFSK